MRLGFYWICKFISFDTPTSPYIVSFSDWLVLLPTSSWNKQWQLVRHNGLLMVKKCSFVDLFSISKPGSWDVHTQLTMKVIKRKSSDGYTVSHCFIIIMKVAFSRCTTHPVQRGWDPWPLMISSINQSRSWGEISVWRDEHGKIYLPLSPPLNLTRAPISWGRRWGTATERKKRTRPASFFLLFIPLFTTKPLVS